jgi:hypothetical protein
MPRERFDVEVPEGTHLGVSRDTDGAYRAHLFDDDTNGLVGHAELFQPAEDEAGPPEDPSPVYVYITDHDYAEEQDREPSETERLVAALLLLGALKAVEKAAPHVKQWWTERAVPALQAKRARLAGTRAGRANRRTAPEETAPAPRQSSQEVVEALDAYKASMSSDEARARFVAALTARLLSDQQLAILRDARIEDEDGPVELGTVNAEQISAGIAAMLEANPSLLDPETAAAELGRVLAAGEDRVPVRTHRIKSALRLPAGDQRPRSHG